MNFKEELRIRTDYADNVIKEFLPEEKGFNKELCEAMNYSVNAGGKSLLFAHGAAHHVRLAKRISGKLPENLNDLLLIENAAVGDGKDRFQHGMLVFDKRWVLLAGDQTRDRLHRAGAVGCDDNGKIFD